MLTALRARQLSSLSGAVWTARARCESDTWPLHTRTSHSPALSTATFLTSDLTTSSLRPQALLTCSAVELWADGGERVL